MIKRFRRRRVKNRGSRGGGGLWPDYSTSPQDRIILAADVSRIEGIGAGRGGGGGGGGGGVSGRIILSPPKAILF